MKATQSTSQVLRSPRQTGASRSKKQYRPGGLPFESLRVGKLEPTANPCQTFDSDGARVSNSSGWSRLLQLTHSRRKTHLHGTLKTRHAICHPTTIHSSPQSYDRELARSDTFDTISQRHATHLTSSHNTRWWFRLGGRFGNTPKCYGISLRCTERDTVQLESATDSNQSQFMRSRVLRSQCLSRRTVGTRGTLEGTSLQRFSSSRDGLRLGKTHSTAQGTRRTQTHWNTMLGNTAVDTREMSICGSSGYEEQHCRSLEEW